ncbi:MAG: AmmeMemoRadiSam system protein B [Candidatus Cloacimonetes bacterium]|nr:AmmeMemoRadiSam system protein B [Candidatus Cloacimonadota bacterium]
MAGIREPVVAGSFYSAEENVLRLHVEEYLRKAVLDTTYSDVLGVISPHAGYVFSGLGAGCAFQAIRSKAIDTAVIIAPSHRVGGFTFSVGDYTAYRTPLGDVEVNREVVDALLRQDGFGFHEAAHSNEHSLEVQLPFLQVTHPHARLVPIVLGRQSPANSAALADILAELFSDRLDRTAFIASTDLSHFYNAATASQMDRRFAAHVERLDADGLAADIAAGNCEACGFGAALTLMHMVQMLGYDKCETLKYFHSGDISGDNSQVVGYLASVFHR